jgi:predicted  nucleic acid-binding Zn-ribbon protein
MEKVICSNCGSVDNYHKTKQEFEDGSIHIRATCKDCGKYIKYVPKDAPSTYIPFGKYKGRHTYEVDDLDYLRWFITICDKDRLRRGVCNRIDELEGSDNG